MKQTLKQLLESINEAPDGPGVAAIFDFDGTLISGYSATVFVREQIRRGEFTAREFAELMNAMLSFGMGRAGFSAMMAVTAQLMQGVSEQSYWEMADDLYKKQIARLVYPESRALLNAHLKKGHTVAIISSATPYQVQPAARDLGVENVLCTQLEVEDGLFTGAVVRPTCFAEGKVLAAEQLAERFDADLDQSFFYSDSTDDQLLLERVGYPRALNPSSKLERLARRNRWPRTRFGSRGTPSFAQYARSVAATGSLVSSFLAGLPVYALTGSMRDARNFSFSLFADTASALIGLEVEVKGEENLWSNRPAVFIFNHQSKADVIIIARLLRRDIAGVGKKEIRKMPVIGQVMEAGGVVLIDRENTSSAIEAMQPLVDAIRNEQKCVVIAPEGTRTVSPRLNPFKKGAFHLAMQAGVPIIPIVIHNAGDVAPKGDFVFRPATVKVEVLPAVDTSHWDAANLSAHVREVRNLFLAALGQAQEQAEAVSSEAKAKAKTKAKTGRKKSKLATRAVRPKPAKRKKRQAAGDSDDSTPKKKPKVQAKSKAVKANSSSKSNRKTVGKAAPKAKAASRKKATKAKKG